MHAFMKMTPFDLPASVEVCECTGGGIRLTGLRQIDFESLHERAATQNKVIQIDEGKVTLYPEPAEMIEGAVFTSLSELKDFVGAKTEHIQQSGAVAFHTLQSPSVGSNNLLAVLRFPNVLKITIDDNFLIVQVLLPSEIKQGIAHQKRTGQLNRTKRMKKTWPKAFQYKRRRQTNWWEGVWSAAFSRKS